MEKGFSYGGQAVIEGVMMRGPEKWAVAVRRSDQTIALQAHSLNAFKERHPWLDFPFLRGPVVLVEALVLGIKALTYAADQAQGEEEKVLSRRDIVITMAAALLLATAFFVLLPAFLASLLTPLAHASLAQNMLEGIIRILLFLGYIFAIGFTPDIKRVFQYHGAEHKVINALEAREELNVGNVQRHTTFHPRCGTSFLLWVALVAVVVFSLLGRQVLWWRLVSRLLLTPVVAGLSYEILRLTGRCSKSLAGRIMAAPGRWLQSLTTRPPDDAQVEVAIAALQAVLKDG